MKKIIQLLSITIFCSTGFCYADIIKFETNDWSDKRPLVWTGTLKKIDPESNLVYFEYKMKDKIRAFQVHITRIYSLTIDSQDRVDKPLPETRQNLSTPLPSNPHSKRILELSNQNFVTEDIPGDVKVRPDREKLKSGGNLKIYLNGNVVSANLQKVVLMARAANRSQQSFEIQRSDLIKWIR
ncbi:hypothetical protein D1164_19705 [Mariniphaga sediminis]|uniref:DUF5118 domain-containing protein n=1 Tax=Mariniphaga sediminis TaxID=1628158 RepID=A0A399CYE1_9BACT|nr:hypothetical protein [Mariniphaga sediminis]RIH63502.1 hypothetical protein D1164_19705 [Mariniphaga sediminis]